MSDFDVFKNKNTILKRGTPKIVYYLYIFMIAIFLGLACLLLW